MPRLQDYLGERELLEIGKYAYTIKEVGVNNTSNKEHPTVQIKGEIDGKKFVIFRYLHPNMLWLVATELVALGAAKDEEIDLHNADSVANAYGQFVGSTVEVKCKIREYDGKKSNEFQIQGLADGAAFGAV